MMVESRSLSQQIKDCIREKIGRVNLLEDRHREIELDHNHLVFDEDNGVTSKHSHEKRIIDDFVSVFTSKTSIKEQSKDF